MKILKLLVFGVIAFLPFYLAAYKYNYQSVDGDPINTLMYTLPNGLKLYMSVNKDRPRIQVEIAVKVGSKNDPPETTGLAHYFEHMMFKGTEQFGTIDYAVEKPLLDKIETLFEIYRSTTDSLTRAEIYHQIDSLSFFASHIAIPNEYDKLMAAIGAEGSNAFTSYDNTCYVEDLPSNELERWARIQADRFANPVLRGFHTELETIYEEKNMSLTDDTDKAINEILAILFPYHPYGQWDVLGLQTHLKNPSITNIKKYHKQWYVPNNMAILLAGDFDPDEAVDIVSKHFGSMKPNPNLPVLATTEDIEITQPIKKDVFGNDSEFLLMGWAFPKITDSRIDTLALVNVMLNNDKAGLIDVDINNKQLALGMSTAFLGLADKSMYCVLAYPNEGQTLEDLEALVLEELEKLSNGDFDEDLVEASINNYKLYLQKEIESNTGRTSIMESIFINGFDPSHFIGMRIRPIKITKDQIVHFAKENLRNDNYAAIFKRHGSDTTQPKIPKQPITPLEINRDISSKFFSDISSEKVSNIEPVFIDFEKELDFMNIRPNIPVIYKRNTTNDIFTLTYVYDFGSNNDPQLALLNSYFPLLGTRRMTNDEIAKKFYEIACDYFISIGSNQSYLTISGLSENMVKSVEIVEELMYNAVPDADVYANVVEQTLKKRADSKLSQESNFSALQRYVCYGPEVLKNTILSNQQIRETDPKDLIYKLSKFNDVEHSIIYYGPMCQDSVANVLNTYHRTPLHLADAPARKFLELQQPQETIIFIAPYDANQIYMMEFANDGSRYDPDRENLRYLFNEYLDGGMSSIVFQEMREARSLAYSASAYQGTPSSKGQPYSFIATIATQNDKMMNAINGFEEIIENMPEDENAFLLTKQRIDSRLRTQRTIKDDIAWAFINRRIYGIENRNLSKELFEALPDISITDVMKYHKENVKGRKYYIGILGNPEDLDIESLNALGKVVFLTTDEIFFYGD